MIAIASGCCIAAPCPMPKAKGSKAKVRSFKGQVLQYDKPTDRRGSWHDLFAWSSPARFTI